MRPFLVWPPIGLSIDRRPCFWQHRLLTIECDSHGTTVRRPLLEYGGQPRTAVDQWGEPRCAFGSDIAELHPALLENSDGVLVELVLGLPAKLDRIARLA